MTKSKLENLKIISAGAGSGKTYTLTQKMTELLRTDAQGKVAVRASGIIATTFTKKAASELQERVRVKLLEEGLTEEADALGQALIGTVHSIGVQLLKRFAFEAGVAPSLDIIEDREQQGIFNRSLATVLDTETIELMDRLSDKLGLNKNDKSKKDWRIELKELIDLARSNNLGIEGLEQSKAYSINSFFELLPEVDNRPLENWELELRKKLGDTIFQIRENTEDSTKGTRDQLANLQRIENELHYGSGQLPWYVWVQIMKACDKLTKKSKPLANELLAFVRSHDKHPQFQADIRAFIAQLFDLAIAALAEYERYKKSRGLIDYTDMEVLVLELMDNKEVQDVLRGELDLLLVDEFQDTNPIQLKIFLRLSQLASRSIWVGDPKQSIYGFRGADPSLMQAIVESCVEPIAILPNSWRSRQDLVHACNGLFVKAFEDSMPPERVALQVAPPFVKEKESPLLQEALQLWQIQPANKKTYAKTWFMEQLVSMLRRELDRGTWIVRDRYSKEPRVARPGDVAILCRSNKDCESFAQYLHEEGMQASISRSALIQTPEITLALACLKLILNEQDSLSVAEVMLLSSQYALEEIIDNRLSFLARREEGGQPQSDWGKEHEYIATLKQLRIQVREMSAAEILELVLERLELRRLLAAWPNAEQRLDNIEALRSLAQQHEASCNRMHSAATLGGFLLWLSDLSEQGLDMQGQAQGDEVVQVLTYHKSKGLEWPIVISFNLDGNIRDDVFGLRIESMSEEIDILDPLANRLICYWINPYDNQKTGTALLDAIEQHPAKLQARKNALDEEARLLYVGFTRARDYLIIPMHPKLTTKWLNRVFHKGEEATPTFSSIDTSCPWLWNAEPIPLKQVQYLEEEAILEKPQEPESQKLGKYWDFRAGMKKHRPVRIEQNQKLFPQVQLQWGQKQQLYKELAAKDEEQQHALGLMLSRFFLASFGKTESETKQLASNWLIEHSNIECLFSAEEMQQASKRIEHILYNKSKNWQKLLPFQWQDELYILRGQLSFFLDKAASTGQASIFQLLPLNASELNRKQKRLNDEAYMLYAALQSLGISKCSVSILSVQEGLLYPLSFV